MIHERIATVVCENADVLGSSGVVGSPVAIRGIGLASVHVSIDDGAGGAPLTSVAGKLLIECSADGAHYSFVNWFWEEPFPKPLESAKVLGLHFESGDIVGLAGKWLRCRYERASGGGGDSRLTVSIVTW